MNEKEKILRGLILRLSGNNATEDYAVLMEAGYTHETIAKDPTLQRHRSWRDGMKLYSWLTGDSHDFLKTSTNPKNLSQVKSFLAKMEAKAKTPAEFYWVKNSREQLRASNQNYLSKFKSV